MEKKEYEIIEKIISDKICNFIILYMKEPNYLIIPYWIYEEMKRAMVELTTKNIRIDYKSELVTYRGLRVCPTIAKQSMDEIEVF